MQKKYISCSFQESQIFDLRMHHEHFVFKIRKITSALSRNVEREIAFDTESRFFQLLVTSYSGRLRKWRFLASPRNSQIQCFFPPCLSPADHHHAMRSWVTEAVHPIRRERHRGLSRPLCSPKSDRRVLTRRSKGTLRDLHEKQV